MPHVCAWTQADYQNQKTESEIRIRKQNQKIESENRIRKQKQASRPESENRIRSAIGGRGFGNDGLHHNDLTSPRSAAWAQIKKPTPNRQPASHLTDWRAMAPKFPDYTKDELIQRSQWLTYPLKSNV